MAEIERHWKGPGRRVIAWLGRSWSGTMLSGDQGSSLRCHGNMLGDSDVRVAHRGNINNQVVGECFYYGALNFIMNYSDFVILGLDLLLYSSVSVNK